METETKSFYKRKLPDDLVPFSSKEGKELFKSALLQGNMEGYFQLAEQFLTQDKPDHCANSTLVMTLNTLSIDPGRVWIKPWRWYSEDLLACLKQKSGLSLHEYALVGLCNGLWQQAFYPLRQRGSDTEAVITMCCGSSLVEASNSTSCSDCPNCGSDILSFNCCNPDSVHLRTKCASLLTFRAAIKASIRRTGLILVLNHSRKALNQTGDGHYSPVAGYDEDSDMALVLDVARFKYPAFWCPVEKLYHSLEAIDSESGKTRGFLLAEKPISDDFEGEMTLDLLSISRIRGVLLSSEILNNPPQDLYPILLYHYITLSAALIPDEIYGQFKREIESFAIYSTIGSIPVHSELRAFLSEIADELQTHYLVVIVQAIEGTEEGEGTISRLFIQTLRVQLGLTTQRVNAGDAHFSTI